MLPSVPEEPRRPGGDGLGGEQQYLSADGVGAFAQGTPFSRWALARYLVGRCIAEAVTFYLLAFAVVLLALAALAEWGADLTWLAVLLFLFALGVLLVRWLVAALLRRFTDARRYGPVDAKLRELVSDTRGDVRAELRRIGLPSRAITMPLLAVRLAGKRRAETVERLKQFNTDAAVPPARLDELHMLLQSGEIR